MWKEDATSREVIEDEMKDCKVKGLLTKEQIIALRSGKITGKQILFDMWDSGKLEVPK